MQSDINSFPSHENDVLLCHENQQMHVSKTSVITHNKAGFKKSALLIIGVRGRSSNLGNKQKRLLCMRVKSSQPKLIESPFLAN